MKDQTHDDHYLQLGYLFHYPQIGKPEPFWLEIYLTETPTEKHYDPQKVEFLIVSKRKDLQIEHLSVSHPWKSSQKYRLCPGVIRMLDRKNKVEEALAFGGNLTIQTEATNTFLKITSTAPIIKVTNASAMQALLRAETEILWAERKAHWLSEPDEYERRLVNADPLVLYHATLNALVEKYEHLRHSDPQGQEVLHYFKTLLTRVKKAGFSMAPEPQIDRIL